MKEIKCDNCKSEYEVENNIIMKFCKCGYTIDLIEMKGGKEK